MSRRVVSFELSPELLRQALSIPQDVEIIGAEWNFAADTMQLYVRGPAFPEVEKGSCTPRVVPTVTRHIGITGQATVTWDWKLP